VSDVRCRACGAAVPSEAQWCSLCFADLREPTPVREQVSVPAAPDSAEAPVPAAVAATVNGRPDPDALLGLPTPAERPTSDQRPAAQGSEAAAADSDEAEAVTWPCARCGEQVAMSLDVCPTCGAGFLEGASTTVSVHLPVVGDMNKLSRTQRLLVGVVIAVVVMIVLVLLATIGGHFL
jgi:uncharacterized OB-fold protein